jgi:Protein of unknown function (DUF4238)
LRLLLLGAPLETLPWTSDARSGWSRFLMSVVRRNPEAVAHLNEQAAQSIEEALRDFGVRYSERRRPTAPETFEEYVALIKRSNPEGRAGALLLANVIDSELVGNHLNKMHWFVVEIVNRRFPLLTSDRPVIKSNGLLNPNSYIALPIGPFHLFVAVNTPAMENGLRQIHPNELVRGVNSQVAMQAHTYVYGVDDRHLDFVSKRLRQRPSYR